MKHLRSDFGRTHSLRMLLGAFALFAVIHGSAYAQRASASSAKDCVVCHLDWSASFKQSTAVVLLETPAKGVVTESDTCLGCHDGSIADSRRQVWIEHGHSVGVVPSAGMKIPSDLPLDDGKVSCRTCHTAHVSGFNESLKDAVFLRMKNEQDQLCKACHEPESSGPQNASHTIGQMKTAFPASLAAAGAHAGPANDQVLCQSCHIAHGAKEDPLLIMPTNASQLCVSCHPTLRPAMWDTDPSHDHPQNPPIHKAAQIQAIKDMGTNLGSENRLVCLSCHRMHKGKAGKSLLADTLRDSAMCIRCHEEKKPMIASAHDLRKSAPLDRNMHDETSEQSGVCGSCHTFHSYNRKPLTEVTDRQGLCETCHAAGQVAKKHSSQTFHPVELRADLISIDAKFPLLSSLTDPKNRSMACTSCHDPHEAARPQFLRASKEELCSTCHSTLAKSLAKPHDFTGKKNIRNASGASPAEAGRCGFCHSVHQAKGPMMLAATTQPVKTMEDTCVQCHRRDGIAHDKAETLFNHSFGSQVLLKQPIPGLMLPLFNAELHSAANGSVSCASCHDVHSGEKASKNLLRAATPAQLCVQCHVSQSQMAGGAHETKNAKRTLPGDASRTSDLCLSCHRAHSNKPDRKLWTVASVAGQQGLDGTCVACHADQVWSASPVSDRDGLMLHPQLIEASSTKSKLQHDLPIVAATAGTPAALLCKTCHDPHAARGTKALLRISSQEQSTGICAKCHTQAKQIESSMHRREQMSLTETETTACAPCHRVHAVKGTQRNRLWAADTFVTGINESEKLCLGCHRTGGRASVPEATSHPMTLSENVKIATTQPNALVDERGNISRLTCATCHLTHGSDWHGPVPKDRAEIASLNTMLRSDVDRTLCASCHGAEAPTRFLYFHSLKKRAAMKK